MSLENVDGLDGVLDLSSLVGSLDSHGCINHHVGEEIRLTVQDKRH